MLFGTSVKYQNSPQCQSNGKIEGKDTEQDELMVAYTLLIQHTNPSQYIYTVSVVGKQE